tara:strand:+ start:8246 stop:11545 length:3300 start_codon:yes stop_codon:yes gene_type:complete
MFITAVSSKTAYTPKVGDGLNSLGDLSPATFKVEFDEPLSIKNADIELVSCKVSKQNKIIISPDNNALCVRMGNEVEGEQYKTSIKPGSYTPANLGDAIAEALNRVMPINIHKPAVPGFIPSTGGGWSSLISAGKIQLRKAQTSNPSENDFTNYLVPVSPSTTGAEHMISAGYEFEAVEKENTGGNAFAKFTGKIQSGVNITNPYNIPTEDFITCGGLDLGSLAVDTQVRQAVDNWGIWEQGRFPPSRGGEFDAVLRPTSCVLDSTLNIGYGGKTSLNGATNRPCYWTFEVEENIDANTGLPISNEYEDGSLFTPKPQEKSELRNHPGRSYKSINGVLNFVQDKLDERGPPYTAKRELIFPYAKTAKIVAGNFNQESRRILYDATWTGQMTFRGDRGTKTEIARTPYQYTFELDDAAAPIPPTPNGENVYYARSVVQQKINAAPENVRVRLTESPLIQGLPRQTAANSAVEHSTITGADILVAPITPTVQNIRYLEGEVGQCNFKGETDVLENNTQCICPNGPNKGAVVMPWYKILKVDALGVPIEVILVDSGEYVIRTDTATSLTELNTSLFLNDPNTYEYIDESLADEEDDLFEQIYRFEVRAQDIGASGPSNKYKYDDDLRYASFNMGLMRDDIFQTLKLENTPEDKLQDINTFALQKNFEIDVYSVLFDKNGVGLPPRAQIKVAVWQLQPSSPQDNDYIVQGYGEPDNKKLMFNARTDQLSTWTGTGTAITNWASFPGVADPDAAIQVFINVLDTYSYQIGIANATTYNPAAPAFGGVAGDGPSVLCTTGIKRGAVGQSGIKKFESYEKLRFFPLHPVMSAMPTSIISSAPNVVRLRCCGSEYPERPLFNPWDKIAPSKGCNYDVNISNMVGDQPYMTPQNVPAPTGTNWAVDNPKGSKCMMMIKSQKLNLSQITTTPPPSGSVNACLINDFAPPNGGSLYQANLPDVMFAQIPSPPLNVEVDFPLGEVPTTQSFLPSFVVEIQNLPLSGYLGKSFDDGELKTLKGMGSRLPIVGVVPAKEFKEEATDPVINYYYQTSYYQPTQVRLPTEQSLYSLDINLRDVVSGELLRDLIHSTEVIVRIYNLGDNPPDGGQR